MEISDHGLFRLDRLIPIITLSSCLFFVRVWACFFQFTLFVCSIFLFFFTLCGVRAFPFR